MRIWFNRINESRRSVVEAVGSEIRFGRDADCDVVLKSPLVSRHHATLRLLGEDEWEIENVGVNSCLVGDEEIFGGQAVKLGPRHKVRIWPFTISFESEKSSAISRQELESHLRKIVADLELKIHRKLLERLDLYEMETTHGDSRESIILLENNIEDVCREMNLFDPSNESLLEEITGLSLKDHTINQLILETGDEDQVFDLASLTANEFDVPATLVPDREQELHALLQYIREKLKLSEEVDVTGRINRVESEFDSIFHLVRPHIHGELRKYLLLRTLKKDLKDIVFGYGPLQDLLRAPTISEIMVVKTDQIYVERDGMIEKSGRRFISDKVTESIIERIVAQVGRRIDRSQPLVDARLPDGSRVNAVIPPLAIYGPTLTVRKFPIQRLTMEDMLELGTITEAAAKFLRACVVDRRSILISGGTGSGKTTMLNVVSSFIPHKERIVTIEDTAELKLHQEHVAALESKPPNVEGSGEYTIRDLVKNALRMRPDRIIVGECRGGEAMDMVQAMNTGHDGSMTTVHANSAAEVIQRLEVLMLMGAELPMSSIHRQIASAIDLIVHIDRLPNGQRVVGEIAEVTGMHPHTERVTLSDVFNRRNGKELLPTGRLPSFIDSLIAKDLLELEFLYGRRERAWGKAADGERQRTEQEQKLAEQLRDNRLPMAGSRNGQSTQTGSAHVPPPQMGADNSSAVESKSLTAHERVPKHEQGSVQK
jgi:pilus assembly protein CpaF